MPVHLETERLILRHFTPADVDLLVELDSDPAVQRYLTGKPTPREVVEREVLPRFLEYHERTPEFGFFAAIEKSAGEFTGWFQFRPVDSGDVELGYRLRRKFWGLGYATEGSRALIAKGFTEQGVQRVFAGTMAVNAGSRRVMEKSGLRYVRSFFQDWPDHVAGDEHGDVEYALSKADWKRQHGLP